MEAHSPNWADAVATHRDFLPTERFLSCEVVAGRRSIGRDAWLVSSEIEAPPRGILGSGSDDGFAGEDEDEGAVLGRVIARVLARSSLRIEFGFLPEWAYENAGNNAQTAAADHAVLPADRFITQALINTRRGRWLRSAPPSTIPSEPCLGEGFTGVPSQIQTQAGRPLAGELTVGWIECPISDELNAFRVTGLPAGLSLNHRFASANRRRLVLSGTPSATLTPRSYPVTITAQPQSGGSLLRATTTIQVAEPPPRPETVWDGYRPEQATVGGDVALIPPVVIRGPARPVWSYRSATSDICDVQATSGSLTLRAEGECEVIATLAADLPRWASTEGTAIVRVGGVVLPCITWAGYDPASMTIGGSSPTLLRPRAADCRTNRALSLTYTFRLDNPSTDICQVSSSGSITALREGTCTIVATSASSGNYGSATSSPRSVTISAKMPPCLERVRYAAGSVRVNASLDSPEPSPLPSCLTSQMTYETTTSAICNVDPPTGRLTGSAKGTCRITIMSRETSTLRADSATRQITVSPKPPPEPCDLRYAGNVNVGDSTRANFSCPSGGTPAFRPDDTTICSVNPSNGDVTGRAQGTCSIVVNVAETGTTAATTVRAQLTVVPIPPPTCTTIGNREFSGSQSSVQIDLDRYCDNADSYRASSSNNNVATHSFSRRSQLTLRPGGSEGSSTIQVTATNRGGDTTISFTVSRRTERPVISISCSPSSPMVNQSVNCTYSLISGDEPTSFDWRGGASSGRSMRYTTSFSTPGRKTVSLTARNAGGPGSNSTVVDVQSSPNRAPICDDDPHDVDIDEDDEQRFRPRDYCSDPDGDEVTLRTSSSNSRVAIADSDRRGWKFVGQGHGTATITITATDPGGLSDSARVTVNVRGGPDCHDIPDTVLTTINAARQTIALSRYCRHPSGGSLTYSASTDNTRVARVSVSGSTLTISPGSTTGVANVSVSVSGSGLRTRNLSNWFEVIVNPGGTQPPPPPPPPQPPIPLRGYGLARCGTDTTRVYYFEYTARDHRQWSKHHLNMSWESAVSIWARSGLTWGESLIDLLSQSQCNEWTTGSPYTASTSFTPRSR